MADQPKDRTHALPRTDAGAAFASHRTLPDAGVAVDFSPDWPIQGTAAGTQGLYQFVGDTTGVVFVRYGPTETVEGFLHGLGDMLTTATVESDDRITHQRLPARRVRVLLHRRSVERYRQGSSGPEHAATGEERNVVVLTGFTVGGMPVLAGYRIPEAAFVGYRAVLDRIVASVKPL